MTKVFITGATGYIGGTVLQQVTAAFPSLKITALARNAEKAAKITSAFPNVATVIGDLDSAEVLEAQSALADIVVNTANCDHVASLNSIIRGIEKRGGGYLIHTSGVALLCDGPDGNTLGKKVWDDITDLEELSNFPDTAIHRTTEKIVLAAPASVHTAIVSPAKVYGIGTGPDTKHTLPIFVDAAIAAGGAFTMGTGACCMSTIHIHDLGRMYLLILGEALKPNGGAAQWDAEGYYFGANDEVVTIGEQVAIVADELAKAGKIKSNKVEQKSMESVVGMHPFYSIVFGSNAMARSSRAKRLGWKPVGAKFVDTARGDIRLQIAA